LIDLHLHTTASDGALSPAMLVARAASAGIAVLSVTDHDTVAGLAEAREAAGRLGLTLVSGIEITAVERGRDVHVLGYFFDAGDPGLADFLEHQRAARRRRVQDIVARLRELGCEIDPGPLNASVPGRSIGRPQIADALVAAGHARDRSDAFDQWLGHDRPAFVPRHGPSPEEVIQHLVRAGGIASLAHPGLTKVDPIIPRLASAGLSALEARHSDQDEATELRYRDVAKSHGLDITGGSDFHGDFDGRGVTLGRVTLGPDDFAILESRAR
jgi:predicted metal-dependent phosphoesterase TrpH